MEILKKGRLDKKINIYSFLDRNLKNNPEISLYYSNCHNENPKEILLKRLERAREELKINSEFYIPCLISESSWKNELYCTFYGRNRKGNSHESLFQRAVNNFIDNAGIPDFASRGSNLRILEMILTQKGYMIELKSNGPYKIVSSNSKC